MVYRMQNHEYLGVYVLVLTSIGDDIVTFENTAPRRVVSDFIASVHIDMVKQWWSLQAIDV